jgi:hypothetical protein
MGVKWSGLEVDHSPASSAGIKKYNTYCLHGMDRDNFAFMCVCVCIYIYINELQHDGEGCARNHLCPFLMCFPPFAWKG